MSWNFQAVKSAALLSAYELLKTAKRFQYLRSFREPLTLTAFSLCRFCALQKQQNSIFKQKAVFSSIRSKLLANYRQSIMTSLTRLDNGSAAEMRSSIFCYNNCVCAHGNRRAEWVTSQSRCCGNPITTQVIGCHDDNGVGLCGSEPWTGD